MTVWLPRRPRRPWRDRALCALCAGVFLLTLAALAPHLIHHLADPDHESPTCPFMALSHQSPMQPELPDLAPAFLSAIASDCYLPGHALPSRRSASRSRAPPQFPRSG
jgi:hypothetical protein